ncbi:MAG: hypothetical protein OK439_02560 [Thaumarchaeota archaeon]|nr:hypothetical protein [Nitrososphaerota archaeon]
MCSPFISSREWKTGVGNTKDRGSWDTRKSGISKIASISLTAILIVIVVLGVYLVYSLNNSNGVTSTSSRLIDSISLAGFSLDPLNSNVSGTVQVISSSPLVRTDLYINGTFMGSMNYTRGLVTGSTYSMMYSINPGSMPMMSRMHLVAGRSYMITLMALFSDGTRCNASSVVVAGQERQMMSSTNSMMGR